MSPRRFTLDSPEQTFALGVHLGQVLQSGNFIGLIGELGAGKTQFTRGVAQGAGVPSDQVASPTFAIVYPYVGRLPLYHADFYRLANADELYATGFDDLIQSPGAVLVEWLDRIPGAAPSDYLRLEFTVVDDQRRWLDAIASGEGSARLLREWIAVENGNSEP